MRGQLEEARKRREAETREHNRRLRISPDGDIGSVPHQRIVIVGPCASGKSMLAEALREQGYNAHASAQEHSYVQTMWQMTRPSHLIYLEVDLPNIKQRRKVSWGQEYLNEENERLAHARQKADLIINTNHQNPVQVVQEALEFLESQNYDSGEL
jgi:deoxyadenosine/deoxycytidine kinase